MSDARELLALLTCRVQRFHLAPGGIPNLTAEDIAHALGTIKNENARLYVHVKFAGQTELSDDLACAIRRHVMLYMLDKWRVRRIPRPGFLLDLARLAVMEATDPLTCTTCGGVPTRTTVSGKMVTCADCNNGRRKINAVDRALFVGISESSWSDLWSDRYRDMQIETVDKWEDIALGALAKRLA